MNSFCVSQNVHTPLIFQSKVICLLNLTSNIEILSLHCETISEPFPIDKKKEDV